MRRVGGQFPRHLICSKIRTLAAERLWKRRIKLGKAGRLKHGNGRFCRNTLSRIIWVSKEKRDYCLAFESERKGTNNLQDVP